MTAVIVLYPISSFCLCRACNFMKITQMHPPSPHPFANSPPPSQHALPDQYPVSPSLESRSLFISCSPTEPYPLLHHVSGMTSHLNSSPLLCTAFIIDNHNPSSSFGFSVYHSQDFPLKTKMPSLQKLTMTHPIPHPPTLAPNQTHLNSHFVSSNLLE